MNTGYLCTEVNCNSCCWDCPNSQWCQFSKQVELTEQVINSKTEYSPFGNDYYSNYTGLVEWSDPYYC